jgi:hypothetical protein
MSRTIISIIGSAGRGEDAKSMSATRYSAMVTLVESMIEQAGYDWTDIELRSGGAAWCDHIAITLFLKHKCKLSLFLPCDWKGDHYNDNGSADWRVNPGRTSNYYHKQFSDKMGYDTLAQIEDARLRGAILDVSGKGFHNRNRMVAKCDVMIAFSNSITDQPTDGGTNHTWKLCKANKIHISLPNLPF